MTGHGEVGHDDLSAELKKLGGGEKKRRSDIKVGRLDLNLLEGRNDAVRCLTDEILCG